MVALCPHLLYPGFSHVFARSGLTSLAALFQSPYPLHLVVWLNHNPLHHLGLTKQLTPTLVFLNILRLLLCLRQSSRTETLRKSPFTPESIVSMFSTFPVVSLPLLLPALLPWLQLLWSCTTDKQISRGSGMCSSLSGHPLTFSCYVGLRKPFFFLPFFFFCSNSA